MIFNPAVAHERQEKFFTMQPIPDYVRWLNSGGEMYCLLLK